LSQMNRVAGTGELRPFRTQPVSDY